MAFTNFSDDIEKLFTCLYFISEFQDYNTIISDAQRVLPDDELKSSIIAVAQQMRRENVLWKPRNLIEIMHGMIQSEINICIGTIGPEPVVDRAGLPLCHQHSEIAKRLSPGDTVISFNYDTIMDYALLNARLIARQSFPNPNFLEVQIPYDYESISPVKFFKPHGSFNWYTPHLIDHTNRAFFLEGSSRTRIINVLAI
jgi:hypothetical protein